MDPRRGINERVSYHLASRGCPASALMHGGGYGVLSLCCDTQPHTCNTLPRLSVRTFWFTMHTGMQTDHDSWSCSLISRQSARDSDMQSDLPKACLAIVLLAACTVAGTSSSVLPVNFGEQLANGLPFKSDEPHRKQIMSDKDLSSNKGIDPHTAGSELVQLGALVHLHGAASARYAVSTPRSISSITTPASLGDGSEVRVIYGHAPAPILPPPRASAPFPIPCCCPGIVKH